MIDQHKNVPYIAVGASGGEGLDDIRALLGALPHSLNAVLLIVLHRPPDRTSNLKEVLSRSANMPVRVAGQEETLQPGCAYIGEPDQHLTLLGADAELVSDQRSIHRNRTIDLLFQSVAVQAKDQAIGVVLSGSLDDGSRGLASIHQAGGVTMVLTPERDRPPGMRENAIDFDGPINIIGAAEFIAKAIKKIVENPGAPRKQIFERE
jgi:two-component system chemotaxis response regulator CheB